MSDNLFYLSEIMLNVLFPHKISGMINNAMYLLQLPVLGAYFSVKQNACFSIGYSK